jgi:hypothetical protein
MDAQRAPNEHSPIHQRRSTHQNHGQDGQWRDWVGEGSNSGV